MTVGPGETAPPRRLRVAVLTCQDFAWETVAALSAEPAVEVVGLVRAPLPRPALRTRLRRTWRRDGAIGVALAVLRVAGRRVMPPAAAPAAPSPVAGVAVHEVPSLNSEPCRALLRSLALDLVVVDGANILQPETFEVPRLGSINLHCGRLPHYRGAPPVFWELMAGEREVGVTVHCVSRELDAGAVLAEATYPIDPAPPGDPVAYARRVWREALRPLGIALIVGTARALARGDAQRREQGAATGPANRTPSRADIRRLRAVVAERRRHRPA